MDMSVSGTRPRENVFGLSFVRPGRILPHKRSTGSCVSADHCSLCCYLRTCAVGRLLPKKALPSQQLRESLEERYQKLYEDGFESPC